MGGKIHKRFFKLSEINETNLVVKLNHAQQKMKDNL